MQETEKIKVAIIGAGREGLETLGLLRKDKAISVSMLLDTDRDALGFRLEEYGYTFADDLKMRLSHRIQELSIVQGLNLVVDTSPDQYHKNLYDLDLHPTEIINWHAAKFIWESKFIEDLEKRRSLITEQLNSVIEAVRHSFQSTPQVSAIDELCGLLLRTAFFGVHADSVQLTMLGKDKPYNIIKDINIDTGLLIKKVGTRPLIREWHEADRIIRHVVENRAPWEGGRGVVKRWETVRVIPITGEPGVTGMIWLFYSGLNPDLIKNDTLFVSSLLIPLFENAIRDAIDSERERLAMIEEAILVEPQNIIGSDKPIGSKLKEVNNILHKLLKAEDSHLYVRDPATGDLVLHASTYKFPYLLGRLRIRKGRGVLGEVIDRSGPVILMETNLAANGFEQRSANREDTGALLYLPLKVRDKGVGIISMEFINVHNLTPNIYGSLGDIGSHLANTISSDVERYRMSQKIVKLSTVNEEGIDLLSTSDLQNVLALATSSSAMLADAEVSILRLYENGKLMVKSMYGIHEDRGGDRTLVDIDNTITGMVSQTKTPALINDILEYTEAEPDEFPYKTAIALPIIFNKELFGTLSLYNKMASEAFSSIFFTEDDREILEYFVQYVARGVVNARRYNERQLLITIDETTGLRNERYLQMRFPEEIKRAKRFGRCVSLIFFEVKPFDDSLIRDMSRLIRETFRYIDVLVRLKEAKFAALLPDTGEGVKDAVRRLSKGFNWVREKREDLTLYVGYSTYPDDSEDMQELIRKASRLRQY